MDSAPSCCEGSSSIIKVIHSNVLSANKDHALFINFINTEAPDIFVVQEVNEEWIAALQLLKKYYPFHYAVPRDDNFGMAIYSKHPFSNIELLEYGELGVPTIKAGFKLAGHDVTVLASHPVPPVSAKYYNSRNKNITDIARLLASINEPLLVIGDFNITMWSNDYSVLVRNTGLKNARKGFGVLPTWPVFMPMLMIPIDHALVSSHFAVKNFRLGHDIGSDHLPLVVELVLQ